MPSKRVTQKRKDELPLVKDPFTAAASKRQKKEIIQETEEIKEDEAKKMSTTKTTKVTKGPFKIQDEETKENKPKSATKEVSAKALPVSKRKTKGKKAADEEEAEMEVDEENGEQASAASVTYDRASFMRTGNGKLWNLKIGTWNINGIRAWILKGGLDYVKAEDADIFCCQETKCNTEKIPAEAQLAGYHCYWSSGEKEGYSGVGLMSKQKPISVTYGINSAKFDKEGGVIVAEYDKFYLINSYVPNSSRGLVRLDFRMEWEAEFRKFIANLDKLKPVIWTGDLNVAHNKIDLRNPDTNTKTAGFTQQERDCFTALLSDGYIDSFRHLYPTQTNAYTFWNYMRQGRQKDVGWRIDYFVLSQRLEKQLADTMIRSKVMGSDHCPLVLFLDI